MNENIAIIRFPGSNCEFDVEEAINRIGAHARIVWHHEHDLEGFDGVIIPGGFAHGDYLRCGAIARFSPVMEAVASLAELGGPVLGICNGFQVLTEAGLLPGALMRNAGMRFVCETVTVEVASNRSALTAEVAAGTRLRLPVNHGEGNYICDAETLSEIESSGQVVLRYANNPNGSLNDIAGITNRTGNIVGLMPHPERAFDLVVGSADGVPLLRSFVHSVEAFAKCRVVVGQV
ncbi:MAG TPA: phosphoribosylformylglycinamidine synthase subunit PurQ [Acidimicrobiales bacterium]|nr:phosphoribosylformylglycinamidine synthase subunit PurQ [Acidimicrobiales bacterium]